MKNRITIGFIVCMLALFLVGCSGFQPIVEKPIKMPVALNRGENSYSLYVMNPTVSEKEFYTQAVSNSGSSNISVVAVEESFYKDYKLMSLGKLPSYENFIYTPASELTSSEKNFLVTQYPFLFTQKFNDTESYIRAQVYYLDTQLGKETAFNGGAYYSEMDKELLIIQLENRYKAAIESYTSKSELNLVPIISVKAYETMVSGDSIVSSGSSTVEKNLVIVSGADEIVNSLMSEKVKSKVAVPAKCIVLLNSHYSGYLIRNSSLIILVGGAKTFYQYKNYQLNLEEKIVSPENLDSFEEDSSLEKLKFNS